MDIAFDTTWCPTCSRQILPKRIQVPVNAPVPAPTDDQSQPLQQAAPAPPPTTPTAPAKGAITRTKTGTIRARTAGGLVHGTGRVKPNGAIRRSPLQKSTTATAATKDTNAPPSPTTAAPPPSPTTPTTVRHKTVIDQSPVPLYCSDECRLADLQSSSVERGRSPTLPPVPHNSFVGGSTDSESSLGTVSGSSVESEGIIHVAIKAVGATASTSSASYQEQKETKKAKKTFDDLSYPVPAGYARLASVYDLPPPPPPLIRSTTASSTASKDSVSSILTIDSVDHEEDRRCNDEFYRNRPEDYSSGIMMAAKRIKEAVERPKEKKRPSWSTPAGVLSTAYALNTAAQGTRRVIPGWTDGSDRWRASVYSLSAPSRGESLGEEEERIRDLYSNKGFVSTPLRSKGVYSTLGESSASCSNVASSSASVSSSSTGVVGSRSRSEAEELYSKFGMNFARRADARMSRSHQSSNMPASHHHHHGKHFHAHLPSSPTGSIRSLPTISASAPVVRKREVPILKKGAEGKLLVPDVKLKRTDSSASFAASSNVMDVVGEVCEECCEGYDGCPYDGRKIVKDGGGITVEQADGIDNARSWYGR
ncbi:uncharacterized protein PHACADRAFT_177136 [Phanerochaete carnosa HHB-10118-sp]|uniref:Uncharacterized protein n=1 Tax=Phanerochaete carnosa (strain HHB-10118-sp) TaxID=650164 RepID=K5VK17_PHACS|nr:uncharacterized protein PHACADRAFT_177136 [Phanerochaete carnosa HHB-10118-sp]EKM51713.1 hypothetical protein PHACADRAFT_177136 [Phanerochaete carnosa HHB-10118-sp]